MPRIIVLGAGRVAAQLVPALVRAGHQVPYVWSRTLPSAIALATQVVGTQAGTSLDLQVLPAADVYLIAVPDAAVPEVLATARFPANALVAHMAGALPLAVFTPYTAVRGGVFYPLQTFSPGRSVDWQATPLCIEAADSVGEAVLIDLAYSLSRQVERVATPQRQALHIAAVFACNFPNHLLGISHALLTEAALPVTLLEPLVRETIDKALSNPPFTVQTGPAARGDEPTLGTHQAALIARPDWLQVYKVLTDSIKTQMARTPENNQGPLQL
ncbi:MAG TPA: DUF2520 domain-containing protein [Hymenobacter sp.]